MSWYVLYADENFCLAKDEYFQKQTYRNRFDILTGNGVQTLTIPIESTGGERKLLRDIRISPEYSGKKTLQAIRSAYGNSAMYDFIEQELEELFLKEEKFLFDFNMKAIDWSMKWFGLQCKIPEERLAEPKILNERWKMRGTRPVELKSYPQVFADRFPFEKDLSILDAIFNLGKTSVTALGHVNNS
ncbi:MAG: WbqC family protein [Sediminibacterium sp.]